MHASDAYCFQISYGLQLVEPPISLFVHICPPLEPPLPVDGGGGGVVGPPQQVNVTPTMPPSHAGPGVMEVSSRFLSVHVADASCFQRSYDRQLVPLLSLFVVHI